MGQQGQQKPERSSWFSLPQVFRNLRFPRRGSRASWMGMQLVDPETQELVASCALWAYGPVGAYACVRLLTGRLIPTLPSAVQAALTEQDGLEFDDLLARIRQENVGAGGEKESRQERSHGHDDAGDGRRGA